MIFIGNSKPMLIFMREISIKRRPKLTSQCSIKMFSAANVM